MESIKPSVAIIDPVGSKAGIDHYDLLLLRGLKSAGHEVTLYSNFNYNGIDIRYRRYFFNTGVSKVSAVRSNFKGFIKALLHCKWNRKQWLVLHVFRAGMFDLFTFLLARIMGFKICAVIHDIESLDTFSISFVRRMVINYLPVKRVVHNRFCKDELIKTFGSSMEQDTFIIPHVNFTDLFSKYRDNPNAVSTLHGNELLVNGISVKLAECMRDKIPVMLFFGQIKKAKGLDILLEALAQVHSDFRLVVAGKPRNESWRRYNDIMNVLNVRNKVIPVIRHISDEERDFLFSVSLAVILPYKLIYQSGVMLMAMSFPLPVIASSLPPNRELITDQVNGILFKSGDARELAAKIDAAVNGNIDLKRLSNQALMDVDARFNYKRIGQHYSDLLN